MAAHPEITRELEQHGIRPSAQRVAIADYVLRTTDHPSADRVFRTVREAFPMVSRATVYNTLKLFVEKGLLRELVLAPGFVVYDPNTELHHHFIEESTGTIHDVPWDRLQVRPAGDLGEFEVRELSVVMRGRRRPEASRLEPGRPEATG